MKKIHPVVAHLKRHYKKYVTGAVAAASVVGVVNSHKPTATTQPIASSCHVVIYQGASLPDPTCTPGTTNTNISQATINQTLCNPQWSTKTIRPPVSYTNPLKLKQMGQYGFSGQTPANFELDHLISLELGGNPTDPQNLWPEPYAPTPGAHEKDSVENYLHKQVCAGSLTLEEAQKEISTNWVDVYNTMTGAASASDAGQ